MKLNRDGLNRLLLIYPKGQLARVMGVSLPALRRYIGGTEPQSEATISFMNTEINRRLGKLPEEPVLVLMRYLNLFANHRISMDETRDGVDGAFYVLRYPVIISECRASYHQKAGKLLVEADHLDNWLRTESSNGNPVLNLIVMENLMKMDLLTGTIRCDLLEGSGLHGYDKVAYVFDVAKPIAEKVRIMLDDSATREDPEQDGRVNMETVIK